MGAAMEAALYGVPSIGVSLTDHNLDANFDGAVMYAREVIKSVIAMSDKDKQGLCLNVNIPDIPKEDIKGMKYCRQTKGCWKEEFIARQDPHGNDYYWMSGRFHNEEPEALDTDEWALKNGHVSIVPVQMDVTNYTMLSKLQGTCEKS